MVTLIILVYLFLNRDGVVNKNLFKVEDLSAIDQVVLKSKSDTVAIAREGSRWKVNGKSADAEMVQVLMATLLQAEPRRPLSNRLQDSTARAMKEDGVLVTLTSGKEVIHAFYAGGNRQKSQAYFMKQGEATPYAMVIPGYRVYVSGIFEVDEAGWIDRRIFNFNWRNFTSLKASFADPADGFEVTFDGKFFSVAGVKTDTARLNTFLDDVSLLEADRFVVNKSLRDSLAAIQPEVTLKAAALAGTEYTLSLYGITGMGTVYGLTGEEPVAVFNPRKMSLITKRKPWFVLK